MLAAKAIAAIRRETDGSWADGNGFGSVEVRRRARNRKTGRMVSDVEA